MFRLKNGSHWGGFRLRRAGGGRGVSNEFIQI